MSRTWHHHIPKLLWKRYFKDEITRYQIPHWCHYSYTTNPNWWNVLYFHRPQRRLTKCLEGAIVKLRVKPDAAIWPLSRKPMIYYW